MFGSSVTPVNQKISTLYKGFAVTGCSSESAACRAYRRIRGDIAYPVQFAVIKTHARAGMYRSRSMEIDDDCA
jgi:hypothetical protein